MSIKNFNDQFTRLKRGLTLGLALFIVVALSACQSEPSADSIMLAQTFSVTLRDLDNEYAAAKRANLSFYSPRFFSNLEKAYQAIAVLRKNQNGNMPLIDNNLTIFKHNLRRAYATKASAQQRLGKQLVQFLKLESGPGYDKYPEQFAEVATLMSNCLKLLELRQIDSLSWDKLQAEKFSSLRDQFQRDLEKLEKQTGG